MKLHIENFGPIRKASVELKPLTIFVGPSNTGKSYLATFLYALQKTLNHRSLEALVYWKLEARFLSEQTSLSQTEDLTGFAVHESNVGNLFIQEPQDFILDLLNEFSGMLRSVFRRELERCFGEKRGSVGKENGSRCLSASISGHKDLSIDLLQEGKDRFPKLSASLSTKITSLILSKGNFKKNYKSLSSAINVAWNFMREEIFEDWLKLPLPESTHPVSRVRAVGNKAHYLPAARGGIVQSHSILVSSIIQDTSNLSIRRADSPTLTGALSDFLDKLVRVGMAEKARDAINKEIREIISDLEEEITRGKIEVKLNQFEYPQFYYRFEDTEQGARRIPLLTASSSVAEIAPIVLLARHYLNPQDTFIVEEPESHLHAGAQRFMAKALVRLANAGVSVVVTTHSDIILQQIGNHISASKIKNKSKVLGDVQIAEKDVAVFAFRPNKRGTVIESIKPDEDTGILPNDYLDVSSELYNESADLFNALQKND